MKKIILLATLTAASLTVSGCGWLFGDKGVFRDRGDDYRRAQVEKPLEGPPGLTQAQGDEDFAIPPIAYAAPLEGRFEVPLPDPLDGNPEAEQVKIQTLDGASWILVEAGPGEVWPRLRQFLSTNQLQLARADAAGGVLETGWLQPSTDGAQRERYRFRIEQGVQRNSSEIYVLQANAGSGGDWPIASSDRTREAEMVKAVAQFIADNGSTGAVSMLAQRGIDSKGKVFSASIDRRTHVPACPGSRHAVCPELPARCLLTRRPGFVGNVGYVCCHRPGKRPPVLAHPAPGDH